MIFNRRWQRTNIIASVVALTLLFATGSLHAMTPAATVIENRAEATYIWDDELLKTWSNWVSVTVSQVVGVDVTPRSSGTLPNGPSFVPAYDLAVTPEQRVLLPYRIHNTGNATDTFNLEIRIHAQGGTLDAGAFDPVLYHDLRGDGFVDPSDPKIDRITIAAGQSAAVILSLRISPLVMDEEPIFAAISATSASDLSVAVSDTWSRLTVQADAPIITASRSMEHRRGPMWPSDGPPANGDTIGLSGVDAETGDLITHTITLDNMGYEAGTDIILWEPIDPSEELVFDAFGAGFPLRVSGTPTALETTPDSQARLVIDSEGNQGIQLRLPRMDSTQRVIVEYQVKVDWQPGDYEISKTAHITYDERPGQSRDMKSNTMLVLRGQKIALRIRPRGELPTPDSPNVQIWPEAIAGQIITFHATVHNTGRTAGVVELITGLPDLPQEWNIRFYRSDGVTPLTDTNNNGTVDLGYLAIGDSRDLVIGVEVPGDPQHFDAAPYTFPIKAYFATVPELGDITYVQFDKVTAIDHVWDPLIMIVDPPDITTPGAVLTYSLYFGNASTVDAYNVTIVEQLSEHLEPPTQTDGEVVPITGIVQLLARSKEQDSGATSTLGSNSPLSSARPLASPVTGVYDPASHAITWTISHVPSETGGILTFVSQVTPWTPQSAVIEVQGILSSNETSLVAVSNVVSNVVLTDQLLVTIASDHQVLTLGDANRFTVEVRNPNPLVALDDVEVHVFLPPGLSYREGSSRLGTALMPDPVEQPGKVVYTIPRIGKGSIARLTFETIVNAAAENELVVSALAMMEKSPNEWVRSPLESVRLVVIRGILSDRGVIVGRVLLNSGGEGPVDSAPQGVPGIRVVLDNGQYAVSDLDGRFSFPDIDAGTRLLRLDPLTLNTVDMAPGGIDPAQAKTRRVVVPVGGIAIADFMLSPPEFEITSFEHIVEEGND